MLRRTIKYFWNVRQQFLGYTLVGGSAFILDIGTLILLKEFAHLKPVTAVIINQLLIVNYVFFLNKYFSFRSRGQTRKQIIRFYLLSLWNYIFAVLWMWLLNEKLGWYYLVVRVSGIILAVCWNFLLYKYWIYKAA